ncbi:MAG: GHMP kinase [Candidatus Daviesbacteria bacterium]|nr:GHMP kinase [Candidatus Daviesbacteria bacterium]
MIITQTPLRISFAGGGSDLLEFYGQHGGAVISSAIDKYIYIIVKKRFDDLIVLNWSKKETVESVDQIEHELIREVMRKTGVYKSVEITTISDIPSEGSGLGSSSSVTVGLLQILYLYQGIIVDAERLAREACEIEIDILGKPIGKQDQYIAAYGGLRHFEFKKDGTVTTNSPNIDSDFLYDLGLHMMLFFTGKTRKAEEILSEQKRKIKDLEKLLKQMRDQSFELLKAFNKGDLTFLGQILEEGWELKKQLLGGISTPEIDKMYNLAKEAGALGGKITGAGGGGFLLIYVPLGKQDNVRNALASYQELRFSLEQDGSKSILNTRR